jgi:hemolysin type calcium-binding protein
MAIRNRRGRATLLLLHGARPIRRRPKILVASAAAATLMALALTAPAGARAAEPATPSLSCQRLVTVPDGVDMWTVLATTKPGDCIQTADGGIPAPPEAPAKLTSHCNAVLNGTEPGRVQIGNDLGHLKGGDEVFEGDQAGSPAHAAPAQADVILAGPGDDTIFDYSGDNCLYGEDGDDWIHGGSGDDLVDGGSGADTLYGGAGDDYVNGDDLGNPTPEPGQPGGQPAGSPPANVDLLDGGPGNDILVGGYGVDEMYGGPGNDLCIGSVGGDGIDMPEPGVTDQQRMQDYPWVPTGHDPAGNETGRWLNKFDSCETIWTKTMAPNGLEALLVVDGTKPPESAPGAAKPTEDPCSVPPWARWQLTSPSAQTACLGNWPAPANSVGQPHTARLWPATWSPPPAVPDKQRRELDAEAAASAHRDLHRAMAGANDHDRTLLQQALSQLGSFSTAQYPTCGVPTMSGAQPDNYLAGSNTGTDQMYTSDGNNRLDGFGGNDCLSGGPGNDVEFGGQGNDVLFGEGGANHLIGGAGNDVLIGGPGTDWLYGGTGDDVLDGGPGINYCFGQSGFDVFINCTYIIGGLDQQNGNDGNIERY